MVLKFEGSFKNFEGKLINSGGKVIKSGGTYVIKSEGKKIWGQIQEFGSRFTNSEGQIN